MTGYSLISPYPNSQNPKHQADGFKYKSIATCKGCTSRECSEFKALLNSHEVKEATCKLGINYIVASTLLGPIAINGYVGENRLVNFPRKKKDSIREHVISSGEIIKWITDVDLEIKNLKSKIDSETQKQLNLIHDLGPAVTSVIRGTEELLRLKSKGMNLEAYIESSQAEYEEKTLYKSVEFLTERIALIKLFINPEAITFGRRSPSEVYKLIHKIKHLFELVASKKRCHLKISGNCRNKIFAYDSISALFLSLIDNAIKYSPDGQDIEISVNTDATIINVNITSMGPEFHSDNKKKIFERGFRDPSAIDTKKDGQGLGLFLAQKIAEAHQGWIEVHNLGRRMTLNGVNYATVQFRCCLVIR